MANKRPAEQWYTGDWYRAVDIQKCCPATRGIWRDALDAMTNEQITGKIRGTRIEVCQLLRCNDEELQRFIDDNRVHKFADVTVRNEKVTIICRRLYRTYLEREGVKRRVRKHRDQQKQDCNADVTPYSSTSTSSSTSKKYSRTSEEFRLSTLLLKLILKRKSNYQRSKLNTEKKQLEFLQKWCVHIDRLIRLDKRTPQQIEAVIRWCQADDFWQNNILSTEKLRKQIDKLELGMQKNKPKETPKTCIIDNKSATEFQLNPAKIKVYLCSECLVAFKKTGLSNWGKYAPSFLERKILEAKAKR